jgi:hypothetical protein
LNFTRLVLNWFAALLATSLVADPLDLWVRRLSTYVSSTATLVRVSVDGAAAVALAAGEAAAMAQIPSMADRPVAMEIVVRGCDDIVLNSKRGGA